MNLDVYTTALSILGSLWIIFKYFQQPKDNIGLLLIFVLAISDLFFAYSNLIVHFSQDQTKILDLIIAFSMQFSIMWASGVSYIVYKSLQDTTFRKMRLFRATLGIVILMSTSVVAFLNFDWGDRAYLLYLLPLTLSLILTFIFYSMSVNILKQQAESSPLSTSIYVRTLRSYSLVQFLTYGPLIIFLIINIIFVDLVPLEKAFHYLGVLKTIATLSGFFSALIFVFQGTRTLKKSPNPTHNNLDADLTLDTP